MNNRARAHRVASRKKRKCPTMEPTSVEIAFDQGSMVDDVFSVVTIHGLVGGGIFLAALSDMQYYPL
jgi:hypothetical protein